MIRRLLESSLYCDDLSRTARFYRDVAGMTELFADDRLVALDAGEGTVLLLFRRGATREPAVLPDGRVIPGHDGHGPLNLALAVDADALREVRRRLAAAGVAVESEVQWPRGGTSLYCRDPEGHSLEFATPGLWATW